jgi:hypothetical protein
MSEVSPQLVGYRLNIGSVQPGWFNIDNRHVPGLDCLWDLEQVPWPLEDNSAIIAQMGHVVSRINPARWGMFVLMDELWRILKPGAELCVVTYYGTNHRYASDPAACNPCTEATFYHFDPAQASSLWHVYQPQPWAIRDMRWAIDGNIEVLLAKR